MTPYDPQLAGYRALLRDVGEALTRGRNYITRHDPYAIYPDHARGILAEAKESLEAARQRLAADPHLDPDRSQLQTTEADVAAFEAALGHRETSAAQRRSSSTPA